MNLDDPEVLEKPTYRPGSYSGSSSVVPFKLVSQFCRSNRCKLCLWNSCECDCHKSHNEDLKRLRQEMER